MTGFALQYHFGQYVEHLGGDEKLLGIIWGLGAIGSLCVRPIVGSFTDRFGPKPAVATGALLAALSTICYPWVTNVTVVCALRIVTMMGFATFFTGSAVVATAIAPVKRRAESLGIAGVGGFVGMSLGPTLGDVIFDKGAGHEHVFQVFFLASAGAFLLAVVAAILTPTPPAPSSQHERDGRTLSVVFRHWPGTILLVGVTFTMAQSIHATFLERMADFRGFADIKLFFLTYAPTAIVLRFVFRRVPETFGRRRTLLLGFALYMVGQFTLRTAHTQIELILPAMILGAGHCFIFPSMVDLGADRLPPAYRGTGTSLILGAGDFGFLAGGLVWGHLIEAAQAANLPAGWDAYDVTLSAVGALCLLTATTYAWTERKTVFRRPIPR